jgi:type II secretory pathway pseudopilin PulG
VRVQWQNLARGKRRTQQALTLAEVLVAFVISGLAVAGLVKGYFLANTSAQKFSLSLAANAQASQYMEQMRCAEWDTSSFPAVDQLTSTNFSNVVVVLEASANGTNVTYATNFPSITTVSSNPPLRLIRVDCVWNFQGTQVITNTIETCRAPNQ